MYWYFCWIFSRINFYILFYFILFYWEKKKKKKNSMKQEIIRIKMGKRWEKMEKWKWKKNFSFNWSIMSWDCMRREDFSHECNYSSCCTMCHDSHPHYWIIYLGLNERPFEGFLDGEWCFFKYFEGECSFNWQISPRNILEYLI